MEVVPFTTALFSGAMAGLSVDVSLFPLDTLKTRAQSPHGFRAAGGFTGIYKGLGATVIGSAPGDGIFFTVYESMKPAVLSFNQRFLGMDVESQAGKSWSHMGAACCGEVAACLVRVPTEVVKSNMQTSTHSSSSTVASTVRAITTDGGFLGLYRGFGITIMREIPFALIQFPIYEALKERWGAYQGSDASPAQSAFCGSFGGAIGAAATTPLDVIKTRLMLATDKAGVKYNGVIDCATRVVNSEGAGTLLSGIKPRVMWISIGGYVFFYGYEKSKELITSFRGQ